MLKRTLIFLYILCGSLLTMLPQQACAIICGEGEQEEEGAEMGRQATNEEKWAMPEEAVKYTMKTYRQLSDTVRPMFNTARCSPDTLHTTSHTPSLTKSPFARLLTEPTFDDSLKIIRPSKEKNCFWRPLPQTLCFAAVGLGVWGLGHGTWFFRKKRELREEFKRLRGNRYFHADDYIQYAPAVTFISLGKMAFIPHRHQQSERFLIGTTAFAVMGVLVNSLKHTIDARRPDGSAHNSFPSGHTATAFVGAELTRLEYGNYYGLGAYLMATTVGVLRMYNNRHWLNDVMAGAGIGVLSAHVADWLFPIQKRCINRIFCKKQPPKAANAPSTADTSSLWVLPSYSAEHRALQLSLQLTF